MEKVSALIQELDQVPNRGMPTLDALVSSSLQPRLLHDQYIFALSTWALLRVMTGLVYYQYNCHSNQNSRYLQLSPLGTWSWYHTIDIFWAWSGWQHRLYQLGPKNGIIASIMMNVGGRPSVGARCAILIPPPTTSFFFGQLPSMTDRVDDGGRLVQVGRDPPSSYSLFCCPFCFDGGS